MPQILLYYAGAAAITFFVFYFFRTMPTTWLLDYNEKEITAELVKCQRISLFPYALILLLTNLFLVFILHKFSSGLATSICYFIICQVLFLIILSDLQTRIIPDQFLILLIIGSIFLWFFQGRILIEAVQKLAAGLGGGLLLWLISWLGSKILKQEAMGMGDVKFLAAAGLITGFPGIVLVFFLAFMIGAIPALFLLVRRRFRPETEGSLPFAPYIALGIIIVMIFGNQLTSLWFWWLEYAFYLF